MFLLVRIFLHSQRDLSASILLPLVTRKWQAAFARVPSPLPPLYYLTPVLESKGGHGRTSRILCLVLSGKGIVFLYLSPAQHHYGHSALCNKVKFMQVVPKQPPLDEPRTGSQIAHDQGIGLPCMQTFPLSLLILSNLDYQNRLLFYFSLSAHFVLFQV